MDVDILDEALDPPRSSFDEGEHGNPPTFYSFDYTPPTQQQWWPKLVGYAFFSIGPAAILLTVLAECALVVALFAGGFSGGCVNYCLLHLFIAFMVVGGAGLPIFFTFGTCLMIEGCLWNRYIQQPESEGEEDMCGLKSRAVLGVLSAILCVSPLLLLGAAGTGSAFLSYLTWPVPLVWIGFVVLLAFAIVFLALSFFGFTTGCNPASRSKAFSSFTRCSRVSNTDDPALQLI